MRYLVVVLIWFSIVAQAQPAHVLLADYFTALRFNKRTDPSALEFIKQIKPDTILHTLTPYLNDSLSSVRLTAYTLLHRVGARSTEPGHRRKIVEQLLNGCADKDSGINAYVASSLSAYAKQDFSARSKEHLRSLILQAGPGYDKLIKLVAFLEMKDQLPWLQNRIHEKKIKGETNLWASYLAMSRLGDDKATHLVLEKVSKLAVDDEVVYTLFPDLLYTRQKPAIDYLIKHLYSDEKNCSSSNPEHSGSIACAYRMVEYLAIAIKNFPVKVDEGGELVWAYTNEALNEVRKWMSDNNDLYEIDYEHY